MRRMWTAALLILVVVGFALPAFAVEVAPRISDREIIEALAELKAGQKSLQQQLNEVKGQIAELRQSTRQQIDDLKQSTQQQISDLRQDMNQRFQDLSQRFNDVMTLLQILIGVLVLVLGGIVAWLITIWRGLVRVEERRKAFEL